MNDKQLDTLLHLLGEYYPGGFFACGVDADGEMEFPVMGGAESSRDMCFLEQCVHDAVESAFGPEIEEYAETWGDEEDDEIA